MKKTLICSVLILLICFPIFSKSVVLNEIFNPSSIKVEKDRIFIAQDANIFIYSAKDFNFIRKFGKKGPGPKEFKQAPAPWMPTITLFSKSNSIFVNSMGKVSHFSKDGVFIKEHKTTGVGRFGRYIPMDINYILIKRVEIDNIRYAVSFLIDPNFKKIKTLCRVKFPQQSGRKRNPILMAKIPEYFDRYSSKDKYVLPDETGKIHIFDKNGNKIQSFTPEYTKVKIDKKLEKKLDNYFLNHKLLKNSYMEYKSRKLISLGESLPLFNYYRLTYDKIFIISSHTKDENYETFVYNYEGKLIKKIFLPIQKIDVISVVPFDIFKNKLYQLVYNDDNDEMNLVINEI